MTTHPHTLGRALHFAWGLFIGALIGACGLIWIELYDLTVGLCRAGGLALLVLAICSKPANPKPETRNAKLSPALQ